MPAAAKEGDQVIDAIPEHAAIIAWANASKGGIDGSQTM